MCTVHRLCKGLATLLATCAVSHSALYADDVVIKILPRVEIQSRRRAGPSQGRPSLLAAVSGLSLIN